MDIKRHLPTIAIVLLIIGVTDGLFDHRWLKAAVLIAVGASCAVVAITTADEK